ncbi:MAG: hypothetical protein V4754_10365 [Pseudomonadota bacterium]
MGGPEYCSVLLPDGAILPDVCSYSCILTLDSGRLHLAIKMRRRGNSLLVYDSVQHCIHELYTPCEGISAETFFDQLRSNPADAPRIVRAACLHADVTEQLHHVLGLWLDQSHPETIPPYLNRRLRNGSLLEAHLILPPDLRGAREPPQALFLRPYRLTLDGQETGRHVSSLDSVLESPNGICIAVKGFLLNGFSVVDGVWHICRQGQWYATGREAWAPGGDGGSSEPYCLTPVELDDDGRWQFELRRYNDDFEKKSGTAGLVNLRVSWKPNTVLRSVSKNRISMRLPKQSP